MGKEWIEQSSYRGLKRGNAFIHRDYSRQAENAYISVTMCNDQTEILNQEP